MAGFAHGADDPSLRDRPLAAADAAAVAASTNDGRHPFVRMVGDRSRCHHEPIRRVNLAASQIAYDDADPEGFHTGMFRFGKQLGARETGASLYELPPGQALCPYHYEYGEEEWLLVLEGRPSVRHANGVDQLEPLDVLCFPRGPDGAHQVRNDSGETVRVLMWSTVVVPTATIYPDSDKVAVWTGNRDDDVIVERASGVDYWHGEGS
jgi:uncharacterized cupin superfamily protein